MASGTYQFKLVLLGESAVGKSCLVLRFVRGQFSENQESTIGAAFLTQTVRLDEDTAIKFEIWDTAGQERYKSLAPMYYRNANCAVVVYDMSQADTLEKAKSWVRELQQRADPKIIIALAGNKSDLTEQRQVPTSAAQSYAEEAGLLFREVSARSGEGVGELFEEIARKLPLGSASGGGGGGGGGAGGGGGRDGGAGRVRLGEGVGEGQRTANAGGGCSC